MIPRLFTLAIISFWLVMTALLMRSLWFPSDSSLSEVNPGAVLQLIAARGEPSTLDLYDDREIIGHITVQADPVRLRQKSRMKLRITGRMTPGGSFLTGTTLQMTSWMEVDRMGNVHAFLLDLNTGRNSVNLTLSQSSPEVPPRLVLKQNKVVFLDTTRLDEETILSNPLLSMALTMMGGKLPDLQKIRHQAESEAASMAFEARQGKFDLKGSTRQGFVLRFGKPNQKGFRLCVENTGEIVQLETPTSWHFLTETLRPPSAPFR